MEITKINAGIDILKEIIDGLTPIQQDLTVREATVVGREERAAHRENCLNLFSDTLKIREDQLSLRERQVKNREDAVVDIRKVAAERLRVINTMKDSEKELNAARITAESAARVASEKRTTAERALVNCMADKDRLEELLALAYQNLEATKQELALMKREEERRLEDLRDADSEEACMAVG